MPQLLFISLPKFVRRLLIQYLAAKEAILRETVDTTELGDPGPFADVEGQNLF